ncbi:MAG: dihydrofolate reductase [Ferruginibacter sp.]|nr:dihydrofolate reductase [Ferruginibacter sp.]
MRKLIYAINLTADGCCDHTKGIADEELHLFYANLLQHAGILAYGRITYELMVPYWPEIAKNPADQQPSIVAFAKAFDAAEKVVFSRTLDNVDDPHSRLVQTDPAAEIIKLKQEPGKDIYLGGVALPSYLIQRGLVDEFIFVVQPVIAGAGRRLFDHLDLPGQLKLNLLSATPFASGSVAHHYVLDKG